MSEQAHYITVMERLYLELSQSVSKQVLTERELRYEQALQKIREITLIYDGIPEFGPILETCDEVLGDE